MVSIKMVIVTFRRAYGHFFIYNGIKKAQDGILSQKSNHKIKGNSMHKSTTYTSKSQPPAGYYRQRVLDRLVYLPPKRGKQLVELHLPDGVRRLGSIIISTRTFERTMPSNHIHRNEGGVGVNFELLISGKFDRIQITIRDTKQKLETTTAFFIAHSRSVCYSEFEVQRILPIADFGIEKARRWEKERNEQQELFGE